MSAFGVNSLTGKWRVLGAGVSYVETGGCDGPGLKKGVLSWRWADGLADGQAVEASLTSAEALAVLWERHALALYSYAYQRVGPDVAESCE
jgi:hypothetical protein